MSPIKFVTVNTEYGPIKGAESSSVFGRNVYKFQTIPYMKSPVGKLRFRDAQAPEKWVETLDATVDRPSYVSVNMMTADTVGIEDAGVLSVTTPYLDRKLPVAVCKYRECYCVSRRQIEVYLLFQIFMVEVFNSRMELRICTAATTCCRKI